jgi:hypothetical protein
MSVLTKANISRLFELLNEELRHSDTIGELFLVGGAVMCLVYNARPSTKDIDAVFQPVGMLRKLAARVAVKVGIDEDWLNDAAKGFMSPSGDFATFLELDHLRIMAARPEYLLAMKCMAMRIGGDSRDQEDVRFLLRLLNVRSYDEIVGMVARYFPVERIPQKTLYALEDLLPKD